MGINTVSKRHLKVEFHFLKVFTMYTHTSITEENLAQYLHTFILLNHISTCLFSSCAQGRFARCGLKYSATVFKVLKASQPNDHTQQGLQNSYWIGQRGVVHIRS